MADNDRSSERRAAKEQRLHAELFEVALNALHERRWTRKAQASRAEMVDNVLSRHAKALAALPDV